MSSAPPWRAFALSLAIAFTLLLVLGGPPAGARTDPKQPAQAMTVTVVLDKASYVSGDTATANAIVYRTPAPANYTFAWRVRDPLFRILNMTPNGTSTFAIVIPLNYTGAITFEATVDDGEGLIDTGSRTVSVTLAVMALRLDRGEFSPGDSITATYSVFSHVIVRPTYDYEVDDITATIVLSGNTNATSFTFRTPVPASRTYAFLVTARDGDNHTQAQVSISQASGTVLGVTFDKPTYAPGETIRARLTLTARGTTSLPSQFQWLLTLGTLFAPVTSASAVTTTPEVDLALTVPHGIGSGDVLLFAVEQGTGSSQYVTVHIGISNVLWTTELGGIPLFAVLLGLLFILILVAIVGLWRRVSGGLIVPSGQPSAPAPPPPPPPPEGPARPPPVAGTTPMSIMCRHCGKSIELSTSKRPIEVMCPSCGEPQIVT